MRLAFAHQMMMHAAGGQQRREWARCRRSTPRSERIRIVTPSAIACDASAAVHPARAPGRRRPRCAEIRSKACGCAARRVRAARIFASWALVNIGCSSRSKPALLGRFVEQVAFGADRRDQRRDDFLANRIQRRVRDLREQLLEVVVKQLRPIREHGQRRVVAHRADRLRGRRCPSGRSRSASLPACSRTCALQLQQRLVRVAVDAGGVAASSSSLTCFR